jgi:adenylate cyclase
MEPSELLPRLVAILAADAVNYSKLMAGDDQATIRTLDTAREVFRRCTSLHGGRVVDTAGDSVLAVFNTAMGATSAALAIQSDLNAKAEQASADRRLWFRIGLHLGDVIEKPDGSIYGDGVNIAARLQSVAAPGAVVASESLRLAVRGTLRAAFEALGEQQLKNVAEPVRAHRVIAVIASESPLAAAPSSSTAMPLSILVLPFANHTGLESKSYIADALTTSITSDLTRITDLLVVPALTAFTYRNRPLTLPSVAREAGVRFVLQGSVMASGRRLRIACQLADTKTDSQLWNETFEGDLKNFFALLDQVTARVGNSMYKPIVIAAAPESDRQVMDASVGDLLLRARALEVQTQSLQRFSEIESIYRQILQRDSANLAAMAGLAAILAVHASWLAPYEYTDPAQSQKLTEARDLALAVKAVDPTNAQVNIPIGLQAQYVNDFETARNSWEAALRLKPKSPSAHNNLAVFHLYMGEPARAIPLLERSLELNPRANATVFATLGAANFALGENDRAIGWLLKALDLNFEHLDMYSFLAMAYANIGNAAKSATFAEEYRRRAEVEGVKGPRVNKPRPGSPVAYVSYFYDKLLPDWERAGLP